MLGLVSFCIKKSSLSQERGLEYTPNLKISSEKARNKRFEHGFAESLISNILSDFGLARKFKFSASFKVFY